MTQCLLLPVQCAFSAGPFTASVLPTMHDVTHEAAHSAIFSVVSRQTSMCVGEKSAAVFRTNAFRLSQAAHERRQKSRPRGHKHKKGAACDFTVSKSSRTRGVVLAANASM